MERTTAQRTLETMEKLMIERLNFAFPTRKFPLEQCNSQTYESAARLIKDIARKEIDREKETFLQQIRELQGGFELAGISPEELPESFDKAFTAIAIELRLEIVNVSERLPLLRCQHFDSDEKCKFIGENGEREICRLGESRHMPWRCWDPFYWNAPLNVLFNFADTHIHKYFYYSSIPGISGIPESATDIMKICIFLDRLNDIALSENIPIKYDTNATSEAVVGVGNLVEPDTVIPTPSLTPKALSPEPNGSIREIEPPDVIRTIQSKDPATLKEILPKPKFIAMWRLRAIAVLLIREYRKHLNDTEYVGLSAGNIHERIKNKNPFPKKELGTAEEYKNKCASVRTHIMFLRQILSLLFPTWEIESSPYKLTGQEDADPFEKDLMKAIESYSKRKRK